MVSSDSHIGPLFFENDNSTYTTAYLYLDMLGPFVEPNLNYLEDYKVEERPGNMVSTRRSRTINEICTGDTPRALNLAALRCGDQTDILVILT